jgi:hypothetical protein
MLIAGLFDRNLGAWRRVGVCHELGGNLGERTPPYTLLYLVKRAARERVCACAAPYARIRGATNGISSCVVTHNRKIPRQKKLRFTNQFGSLISFPA